MAPVSLHQEGSPPAAAPLPTGRFVPGNPELYAVLSTILPAIAYPFLPHGPSLSCELGVLITGLVNLVCVQSVGALLRIAGVPHSEAPIWAFPLTTFCLLVADGRMRARRSVVPWTPDEFSRHAGLLCAVLLYALTRCAARLSVDPAVGLQNLVVVLALVAGNMAAVYVIRTRDVFIDTLADALFYVSARRVPGWFWLRDDDDDGLVAAPTWSKTLWVLAVLLAPALVVLWALSLGGF